ncbi:Phage Mu protein F like protein [compost metagenome]
MLPFNRADPTGQGRREAAAVKALRRRVKKCATFYRTILERLEFRVVRNADATYEFRTLPSVLALWIADAGAQVDQLLLETVERPVEAAPVSTAATAPGAPATATTFSSLWFTVEFVEGAYRDGAAKNRATLAAQSPTYAAYRPDLRSVLLSDPYRRRLELLAAREFEEMQNLTGRVKSTMAQVLTQGMASGLGPRDIAKNLTAQTGIEERRAERIARTEINFAHNVARMDQAQEARQELGIKSLEMHVSALSPTTRKTHRDRHGSLHTVQDQRAWWSRDGNSINCYLPGTEVRGEFIAGSKGYYRGPVVEVVTAGGRNLSVTPNHPILSTRGLVAAHELREGEYLHAYVGHGENSAGVVNLDDQNGHATIEQVFSALVEIGHSFPAGVRAVDFHGDGALLDEQVDIVRAEGFLAKGCDAQLREGLDRLKLEHPNAVESAGNRSGGENFGRVGLPAAPPVSVSRNSRPVFGTREGESVEGSLAPVTRFNTGDFEQAAHYAAADAETLGRRLLRLPGGVSLDEIVSINVRDWCGHVFDLEEKSGLMVANGIIASNCKCSTVTVLVGEDGKPLTPGLVAAALAQKKKGG